MSKTRRTWPLFVLAGCSFLPGIGLFFGAAAVTWGLVSSRQRAMLAAGIGAAGAVLNLAGGALLTWQLQRNSAYASSTAVSARGDLAKLVRGLEAYHGETGHYPAQLAVFTELPYSLKLVNIQDFSAGVFTRPGLYQYHLAPDGNTYTVFGVGRDGEPGTPDDVFPALPDSIRQRTGYRSSH